MTKRELTTSHFLLVDIDTSSSFILSFFGDVDVDVEYIQKDSISSRLIFTWGLVSTEAWMVAINMDTSQVSRGKIASRKPAR